MNEPTFDADGYPTEETLDAIRHWEWRDWRGLVEYVNRAWNHKGFELGPVPEDFVYDWDRGKTLARISTWGWSGNEDIIGALEESDIWTLFWHSSMRGGHYEFVFPKEVE